VNTSTTRKRKSARLIQREGAERYLFLTLLSFAASVSLTRLFLSAANYPQIGGGELHIAHVLWGGLLLFAAALLPLLFANRRAYRIGALLAGTGMGLFIDEVGKFITAKNDYFYAPAASIIYVLFLLTMVLFLRVRRLARTRARDALARVFEELWEALHQALTPREYERLKGKLGKAAEAAPSEKHARLANALLAFLDADAAPGEVPGADDERAPTRLRQVAARVLSPGVLRPTLILGLTGIALLTLKNPISVLPEPWVPASFSAWLSGIHVGRKVVTAAAPLWSSMRVTLEWAVGLLLLASVGLFATKRERLATAVGSLTLLLSLTTVSVLLFYFEQFSTIITTTIQFVLLIGLGAYRERLA
jgi:hypothetical protein